MIVLWKPKSSPPRHRSHLLCFFSDKISEMLGLTLVGICIIKSNSSPIQLLSSSSWTWWSASSLITTISSSSSSPICDSCMCHVTAALTSDLRGKHIDHLQTNQWHLIPTPILVPYMRLLVSSRFSRELSLLWFSRHYLRLSAAVTGGYLWSHSPQQLQHDKIGA